MSKYIIYKRNSLGQSSVYRGTYRPPLSVDSFDSDTAVQAQVIEFISACDEAGTTDDLSQSLSIVRNAERIQGSREYDVLRVSWDREPIAIDDMWQRLGVDVSSGFYYSLLSWGLLPLGGSDLERAQSRLLEWRARLNANGLFNNAEDAAACLEEMRRIQSEHHGMFEGSDLLEFVPTVVDEYIFA